MQSDQPNRENLPHPRPTLSTRLSRILVHKMVGRLSQGPRDARDRCLPVCELSPGRDCTMRRVLGAILLACGFWPKPAKRVGQSQFYKNRLGFSTGRSQMQAGTVDDAKPLWMRWDTA